MKENKFPHSIECPGFEDPGNDVKAIDHPKTNFHFENPPVPSLSVPDSVEKMPCPAIPEEHSNDTDSTDQTNLIISTNLDMPVTSGINIFSGLEVRTPAKHSISTPISTGLEKSQNTAPDDASTISRPIRESARIKNTVLNSSLTDNSSEIGSHKLIDYIKRTGLKCKEQLIIFCISYNMNHSIIFLHKNILNIIRAYC